MQVERILELNMIDSLLEVANVCPGLLYLRRPILSQFCFLKALEELCFSSSTH